MSRLDRPHLRLVAGFDDADPTNSASNALPPSVGTPGSLMNPKPHEPNAPKVRFSSVSRRIVAAGFTPRFIRSSYSEAQGERLALNPNDLRLFRRKLQMHIKASKARASSNESTHQQSGELVKRTEGRKGPPVSDIPSETVRRLEDRIGAAEERATLRLAEAMAKLDARFTGLDAQMQGISDRLARIEATASETKSDIASSRRTLLGWLLPFVVGTGIAVAALLYTGQANMMGAFQTGLTAGPAVEASIKRAVEDALRVSPRPSLPSR